MVLASLHRLRPSYKLDAGLASKVLCRQVFATSGIPCVYYWYPDQNQLQFRLGNVFEPILHRIFHYLRWKSGIRGCGSQHFKQGYKSYSEERVIKCGVDEWYWRHRRTRDWKLELHTHQLPPFSQSIFVFLVHNCIGHFGSVIGPEYNLHAYSIEVLHHQGDSQWNGQ